jgi:hypothetical protein
MPRKKQKFSLIRIFVVLLSAFGAKRQNYLIFSTNIMQTAINWPEVAEIG